MCSQKSAPSKWKRLIDVYPDIIGRSIRHCWKVGRKKEWYPGRVVGFSEAGVDQDEYEGDTDSLAGLKNSPCLDVVYDGDDDEVYAMVLDPDWRNGELEVL